MKTDLISDLRALDPTINQAPGSHREAFDELRDAILAQPRPVSPLHAGRWIGAVASAAAMVTATILLWPGDPATRPIPAVPVTSPTATMPLGTWLRTSTPPLAPRDSSVTAWVDSTFVVIGGDQTSTVCQPSTDCTHLGRHTGDGARYDPVTDSWTPIAEAPVAVLTGASAMTNARTAVLGHTIYISTQSNVAGGDPEVLLAYDVDADRWQELPSPSSTPTMLLLADTDGLLAFSADTSSAGAFERYDLGSGSWTAHPIAGLRWSIAGAAVVGDALVVSGFEDGDMEKLWVATVDRATNRASILTSPTIDTQRPLPAVVQTDAGSLALWGRAGKTAWLLNPVTEEWSSVDRPSEPGTFSVTQGGIESGWIVTTAGMVSLHGHLYDPSVGLWSPAPRMPTVGEDPVVIGGPDSVLSCFGNHRVGTKVNYDKKCYLLRPSPATASTP